MKRLEHSRNVVEYLHQQSSNNKRATVVRARCFIKSLIPQGDSVFAIARYPDSQRQEADGTITTVLGGYVGNEGNLPEDTLVMGEIMVLTDIDLSLHRTIILQSYIGKEAELELLDGNPIKLHVIHKVEPRIISRAILLAARAASPDRGLDNKEALAVIRNSGFTDNQYKDLINEKVSDIKPEGNILVYGDSADWIRDSTEFVEGLKDISDHVDADNVIGIPRSKLKKKVCYSLPTIFSGF